MVTTFNPANTCMILLIISIILPIILSILCSRLLIFWESLLLFWFAMIVKFAVRITTKVVIVAFYLEQSVSAKIAIES